MRRNLLFSTLAIGTTALMFATTVEAQRGGRGRGGPAGGPEGPPPAVTEGQTRGRGPGRMADALDLTAEQQAAITRIRTNARDKTAPLADELRLAERNLHREIFAASGDPGAQKTLASRVSTLRQQIADARLQARVAVSAELTPDQRAKLRTGPGPRAGQRLGALGGGRARGGPDDGNPRPRQLRRGAGVGPRGARGPAAGI